MDVAKSYVASWGGAVISVLLLMAANIFFSRNRPGTHVAHCRADGACRRRSSRCQIAFLSTALLCWLFCRPHITAFLRFSAGATICHFTGSASALIYPNAFSRSCLALSRKRETQTGDIQRCLRRARHLVRVVMYWRAYPATRPMYFTAGASMLLMIRLAISLGGYCRMRSPTLCKAHS